MYINIAHCLCNANRLSCLNLASALLPSVTVVNFHDCLTSFSPACQLSLNIYCNFLSPFSWHLPLVAVFSFSFSQWFLSKGWTVFERKRGRFLFAFPQLKVLTEFPTSIVKFCLFYWMKNTLATTNIFTVTVFGDWGKLYCDYIRKRRNKTNKLIFQNGLSLSKDVINSGKIGYKALYDLLLPHIWLNIRRFPRTYMHCN